MFVARESKAITTNQRRANLRQAGARAAVAITRASATQAGTLLEMLIALMLVALLAGAVVSVSVSSGRSFAEIMNYIDLGKDNRVAIDRLTKEVRQMCYLLDFQTNALSFVDLDGSTVRFEYVPDQRTLVRSKNGVQNTLLTDCDNLQFTMYERPPLTNTFDLVPATEATNCKVVGLTWKCSRTILGLRANTESGQTARIVLRNKQS